MQTGSVIPPTTWYPGFHDATIIGWLATVAYCAAFVLCVKSMRRARMSHASRHRVRSLSLWGGLAVVLLVLGLNKQLDLQTAMTAVGKQAAASGGWYAHRRSIQAFFAFGFVGIVLVGATLATAFLWPLWWRNWLAFVGAALLAWFVAGRCLGVEHVLEEPQGAWARYGLELAGLACITAAAWRELRRPLPVASSATPPG